MIGICKETWQTIYLWWHWSTRTNENSSKLPIQSSCQYHLFIQGMKRKKREGEKDVLQLCELPEGRVLCRSFEGFPFNQSKTPAFFCLYSSLNQIDNIYIYIYCVCYITLSFYIRMFNI